MAIIQGSTTSFKYELYQGVHNFLADTFRIALYTANADLNPNTTGYTTSNEVVGSGYIAGGNILAGAAVGFDLATSTAFVNFNNTSWNGANFTTRCALIYNASKGGKAVAIIDFGADKIATETFTIVMPVNTYNTALIRSR